MAAAVAAIYRYPVKGLSAEGLDRVTLMPGECLPHDRRFAIALGSTLFDPQRPAWLSKTHFIMLMRDEKLAQLQTRFDAETGVFMLLYLDLAYEEARRDHMRLTRVQLYEAIVEGAARRLRPKFMTFATMSIGLIPILWSTGTGSEIMKRIAAPMIGGICTSVILELLVYPAIYAVWRERSLKQELSHDQIIAPSHLGAAQVVRTNTTTIR